MDCGVLPIAMSKIAGPSRFGWRDRNAVACTGLLPPHAVIHLRMSLRWRQLDTVLHKNCPEDSFENPQKRPCQGRQCTSQRGPQDISQRSMRASDNPRPRIADSQWKQMLTTTYGNPTIQKTLSHNHTNKARNQLAGIILTRSRITMGRYAQEGHRADDRATPAIDNQLQFTANLCTAHIVSTSPGTTGV